MNKYVNQQIDIARYSLNSTNGLLYISKPIGWDEDGEVFKRSSENHGVFVSLTNNLSFYKGSSSKPGGYDYLKDIFEKESIGAKVILKKEEYINCAWETSYIGYFDFSTFSRTANSVSVMFNETGIYKNIKARISEDLEISRLDTMSGLEISHVNEKMVRLDGRKIVIVNESLLTKSTGETVVENGYRYSINNNYAKFTTTNRRFIIAVPLEMKQEVSGHVQTVYKYDVYRDNISGFVNGETATCFYADSVNAKTINLDINIEVEVAKSNQSPLKARFIIIKYKNGIAYNFDSLALDTGFTNMNKGDSISYGVTGLEVPVLQGDSLCFAIEILGVNYYSIFETDFIIKNAYLAIMDATYDTETYTKAILPHDALENILLVITDKKNILYSKALGRKDIGYKEDGEASYTAMTNGFKVRQFTDKNIKTNLKNFIEAYYAIWQLGFGIEKIGNKEIFRFEHVNHFYQDFVFLKLGVVSDIERFVKDDYAYSSIEVGYSKPSGDSLYEEAMGLDEYNLSSNFTTPIVAVDNKLTTMSPYRADTYGIEFARRKPFKNFSDTDTRYDDDVMLIDLKQESSQDIYYPRLWADDFSVPFPFNKYTTGVYSPETAYNLRLTPASIVNRLGYWLSASLKYYKDNFIRYSSGSGNSTLYKTGLGSDKLISENGNIQIDSLEGGRFNIETIKFNSKVTNEMLKNIKGYRIIDGDRIMNVYGLVEFINEDGYYEYGYLMSLEPKGTGKFELLSSTKAKHKVKDFNKPVEKVTTPNLDYYYGSKM